MAYQFLTKLDWFSTLFPRIPVPIQKQIEKRLETYSRDNNVNLQQLNSRTYSGALGNGSNYSNRGNDSTSDRDYYGSSSRGGIEPREDYSSRYAAPATAYKTEHDDRGYDNPVSSSSYRRRGDDRSPQSDDRYGDKEKHKKKHKRRNRSRSRSNSRSRVREHGHRKHRKESSSRERYRDKDPYSDRKYR